MKIDKLAHTDVCWAIFIANVKVYLGRWSEDRTVAVRNVCVI